MKENSDYLIKMIEENKEPGPHKFGPFTDALIKMLKSTGNTYSGYFNVVDGRLKAVRLIPEDLNIVAVMIAPYLADDMGEGAFAKAESEYLVQRLKDLTSKEKYELAVEAISAYDEMTEQEKNEYTVYKALFSKIK